MAGAAANPKSPSLDEFFGLELRVLSQQLSQPPLYLRKLLQRSNFSFEQGILLLQLSVSTLQFSLTPQEFPPLASSWLNSTPAMRGRE